MQLQSILKIISRVRRKGTDLQIPAEDIVPGDLVLLESRSRIPADLRILDATNLTIDESLLNPELTFLGIAAFMDSLRPDVNEAVRTCTSAGIDVKMIKGIIPRLHLQ